MGNKTPRPVGPSGIEGVSDSVDVELKGRLVCAEVVLSYDQNNDNYIVPFGTKFVLKTENDWEPTASTKLITVYMTCSFTDDMNKVDSDKIRHVLEEKFQSEGQLHINVYVIGTTENEAGKPLSSLNMIRLDINVHGINITHEEILQAIATYLGPEYKLDMIEPTHDHNCIKGILISKEVTLTSNGIDYVVPEGTGFILYLSDNDDSQEKRCQVYVTTEDVKLSYTNVEDVHIFTANVSPFILQRETNVNPMMIVYLICYFRVIDTSLFNTNTIATFLEQTYQSRSPQPIACHVFEVEIIPQTVSPSDSNLIGFNCQILGLPITIENVYVTMIEYFGPNYIVMPPH